LALAELAAIFKLKLHQTPFPTPRAAPPPVFQRPCLAESSYQIMNSPMPASQQMRSQTTIHTQAILKVPLILMVVTPRSLNPSPLRVPNRSRSLSPRNLSQDYFCEIDTAHMAISLGDNHWSRQHQANCHRKRNRIRGGAHEGSLPTTTLVARFWQQMWTPLTMNSRHSRNRYMFLH
jgi:hypothetical protein